MTLSNARAAEAARYNRGRRYSAALIRRIQRLVATSEDGDPGPITSNAVAGWQAAEDLEPDGKLGPTTLAVMEDVWRAEERIEGEDDLEQEVVDDTRPEWCVDLRGIPRIKRRGKPRGARTWDRITGITLHQTAVDFGGPDHPRLIDVPVHSMTFRDGRVALLNPPTALMYHGNGFNSRDIGIEVSCRAAGIEGVFTTRRGQRGANTFWRSESRPDAQPLEATDAQLEATRKLVRYYVELVAARGGAIRFIHAHRQSARKTSDPGSRIWKAVGLWAQQELDLSCGPPGWCLDGGQPIPTAWDSRVPGVPYSFSVKGFEE